MTIEINYQPIKNIKIHEITKMSNEKFIHNATVMQAPSVIWCNEILMLITWINDSDKTAKNLDNNIMELSTVIYTDYKKFPTQGIRHELSNWVISAVHGDSATMKSLSQFLKNQERKQ